MFLCEVAACWVGEFIGVQGGGEAAVAGVDAAFVDVEGGSEAGVEGGFLLEVPVLLVDGEAHEGGEDEDEDPPPVDDVLWGSRLGFGVAGAVEDGVDEGLDVGDCLVEGQDGRDGDLESRLTVGRKNQNARDLKLCRCQYCLLICLCCRIGMINLLEHLEM